MKIDLDFGGSPAARRRRRDTRESELENLAAFHREALDHAAIVAVTDAHGTITSVNQKFCDLSGFSEAELIGANHRIVRSGFHDRSFFVDLYRTISRGRVWHGTLCNRSKNGALYWVDTTIVPHRDTQGRIASYTAIRFDVTPLKEAEQRLWNLANVDPLTGLPNRRRVLELMSHAIEAGEPLAIAILDLDHFKEVNDTAGHDAGDALLVHVATQLGDALAEGDAIGRLGGDEFALIVQTSGISVGSRMAEILETLDPSREIVPGFAASASMGFACFPEDGSSAAELLKCADMALYAAKRKGRNRTQRFELAYRTEADRIAGLRSRVRHALAAGEMTLLYQPIISTEAPGEMNFEALLRWDDPKSGRASPAAFLEALEDEHTASEIGRFVVNRALGQIESWTAAGIDFGSIAINATLADFRATGFIESILAAVNSRRIAPERLCVEITEGMLLDRNGGIVKRAVDRLHDAGIRIAFDDFGTGFASLTHLRSLPIDHVKIDRSFIDAVCRDSKDRVIVESVIRLAHRLGLGVVAEGVETKEQLEALRDFGCDRIQGFLIAPALEADEAVSFGRSVDWRLAEPVECHSID
ncbi:EAL domain-containing protein [Sphingomonas sp. HF-S4]|uniref:EAL domain-containing protein n=1 Tax=Sphingomonas agrestis TaxID=3080540 RepID=A0ABU3Y627_9SPHN|nr:EAL domain-containing protein [Sphingomonas sp. HF-S4]MDV3456834.1 EAL domain-containing protein [Sphingomonas sp. HF-S4]